MDIEEFKTMVRDCKNRSHKLNEWEFTFIDGLSFLIKGDSSYFVSAAQKEKVEEIWERVTS